ncbi:uncharacterized protein PHACADRAFT_253202 [Phanerochaete carnosa HHB-10118-sp]|uniref:Xylanolytic transcriptional activator regulatory domain-containing protein n=1 Tax=Phanerochaete carnosa (strain HHB-10118-sp) TaxID=650164 RepID=K5V7G1_PHACS|nr:uncharacterized protein PHACADRAFT_253202 [Phanerochaete carnosa HHB-10118-sp]EKM58711.1 hypothetical protein PHACADRAFT_253202 [Phanerochaete carnosa HHB-10118-sp]
MEKLLLKLCPDGDIFEELGGSFDKDAWLTNRGPTKKVAGPSVACSESQRRAPQPKLPPVDADDLDTSDDELTKTTTLESRMGDVTIDPIHPRFFGKSSSVMFLQTAMALKQTYSGSEPARAPDGRRRIAPCKRPEYWRAHSWVMESLENPKAHTNFPPKDLMTHLIDRYFARMNVQIPLLHRPTFEKGIVDSLHRRDEGFGSTVLLVCALGARWSDDPRVILPGTGSGHSAGWEWFRQVQWVRRSLLSPPRLYDLQICCLTSMFLHGSSTPQSSWTVIGTGIRLAQDVGAHRRKVYNSNKRTVEDELWKRAFWVLVTLDRFISSALGRPCAIHDEDFDLEMPIECDDEYWIHADPEQAFKQPPGKPSKISAFNCLLRLNQILAFSLRTIYSINKSKVMLGFVGPQWEQHIVAELDSALNKWIDSVPNHLRWDPNLEDKEFFTQSAFLYAAYYHLQIAVHRPFIPSPRKPSALSFPSLAICTNAARSCIHVLDVQFKRDGYPPVNSMMGVFSSTIVLLLSIWGGKKAGLAIDYEKGMEDVHKAMGMLKALEVKWHTAGRIWDILYELASAGELPLPDASSPASNKRDRDSDDVHNSPESSASLDTGSDEPRHIAGSKRASSRLYQQQQQQVPSPFASTASAGAPPLPNSTDMDIASGNLGQTTNASLAGFPPVLGSWYGYDTADSAGVFASTGTNGDASAQQVPTRANSQFGLGQMFTAQSMMYDQVLSNLSASLSEAPAGASQAPTQTQPLYAPQQQQQPPPENCATPDNFTDLLASFGENFGAIFPDFNDGTLNFSTWSNVPQGFVADDWNTYVAAFGGMPQQQQ